MQLSTLTAVIALLGAGAVGALPAAPGAYHPVARDNAAAPKCRPKAKTSSAGAASLSASASVVASSGNSTVSTQAPDAASSGSAAAIASVSPVSSDAASSGAASSDAASSGAASTADAASSDAASVTPSPASETPSSAASETPSSTPVSQAPTGAPTLAPELVGEPDANGISHTSYTAPAPGKDESGLSGNLEQDILKLHNDYRAHFGVGALTWDGALAAAAAANANRCLFEHTNPRVYGENIAQGTTDFFDTKRLFDMWASGEEGKYDYNKHEYSSATGHFTQVVWKGTTKLGCATATCNGDQTYLVCEYDPAGNVIGSFEENVPRRQ
ncbi:hypothetical protein Q8F55_008139 [Vanrija albida]|uniref:SCP domain-containing protein n=1 Tax=Vanrija albida TaxID=181172 RepID=A0ABR3PVE2_9TREE